MALHQDTRHLRSFLSLDRHKMICQYEAPDAETVRQLQRTAEAPFDRVWAANILGENTQTREPGHGLP